MSSHVNCTLTLKERVSDDFEICSKYFKLSLKNKFKYISRY